MHSDFIIKLIVGNCIFLMLCSVAIQLWYHTESCRSFQQLHLFKMATTHPKTCSASWTQPFCAVRRWWVVNIKYYSCYVHMIAYYCDLITTTRKIASNTLASFSKEFHSMHIRYAVFPKLK